MVKKRVKQRSKKRPPEYVAVPDPDKLYTIDQVPPHVHEPEGELLEHNKEVFRRRILRRKKNRLQSLKNGKLLLHVPHIFAKYIKQLIFVRVAGVSEAGATIPKAVRVTASPRGNFMRKYTTNSLPTSGKPCIIHARASYICKVH